MIGALPGVIVAIPYTNEFVLCLLCSVIYSQFPILYIKVKLINIIQMHTYPGFLAGPRHSLSFPVSAATPNIIAVCLSTVCRPFCPSSVSSIDGLLLTPPLHSHRRPFLSLRPHLCIPHPYLSLPVSSQLPPSCICVGQRIRPRV